MKTKEFKMKRIASIIASLLITVNLYGQQTEALKIGTKIPELAPLDILGSTQKFDLNNKTGKLVIVDFFTTGCIPCIASIPKMEALQKEFRDQLEVVMVTPDNIEKVESLKKKSEIFRKNTLPIVAGTRELKQLCPYQAVPTHIWIDEKGTFIYMTDGESSNSENLKKYFGKNAITVTSRQTDFSRSLPLWKQLNKSSLQPSYASIISRHVQGTASVSGFTRDSIDKKINGYQSINSIPLTVLIAALRDKKNTFSDWRRIILEGKARDYKFPDKMTAKWSEEHSYCYELFQQGATEEQIKETMLEDMKRFFALSGKIEQRNSPVLVLKIFDKSKLKSKKTERTIRYKVDDNSDFELEHVTLQEFFTATVGYPGTKYSLPILNETDYEGFVDINLKGKIEDIESVRKQLKHYGLELVEEERNLPFLVLYGI
jgi:thiol-disulfide isomerase/thioredoxin